MKNDDGSVTRMYISNPEGRTTCESKDIKEILSDLGMEHEFIDKLSDDDLKEYANSSKLVATVAYFKVDEAGNREIISEEEALEQANRINSLKKDNLVLMKTSREQDTYEDSYMRVFHLVEQTSYNSEKFKFSTDARWLTMPFFRKTDSIGSCAQYMACDDDTASGWYEYDKDVMSIYNSSHSRPRTYLYSSDFEGANNGTFSGLAAKFDLPNDYVGNYTSILYSDFKIHVQHYAYINEPDQTINFASNGSYDHLRYKIGFNPSISISSSGPSASIGLDVYGATDRRTTGVVVRYEP